jgi:hypothetical protein
MVTKEAHANAGYPCQMYGVMQQLAARLKYVPARSLPAASIPYRMGRRQA